MTYAKLTLQEKAQDLLTSRFAAAPGPRRRVLWWDWGGHLEKIVEEACSALNADFVCREHPLAFRTWTAKNGKHPEDEPARVVWYVPAAKLGRDWFRDVEAMGGVIEKGIEDLAADLYDVQSWELRPWESDDIVSDSLAGTLKDRLQHANRPTFQQLQASILTGEDSQPVEYILQSGWGRLTKDDAVVDKVRSLLENEHVPHLRAGDDRTTIVQKVRGWAVAGWLHHEGVPVDAFPEAVRSSLTYARTRLMNVLKKDRLKEVLATYQKPYWPEIIDQLDDPWDVAGCPVEGALDQRLWTVWLGDFEAEAYAKCKERAEARAETLRTATDRTKKDVDTRDSPAWMRAWQQAALLADLAHRYETWADRDVDVHDLYADTDNGSWHIDASVRRIIVSGTPEKGLPQGHPARNALEAHRKQLVSERYLAYLQTLAGKMTSALESGTLRSNNEQLPTSVDFWSEHQEELGAGGKALLFYLDALRLDLARELSDRLTERSDAVDDIDLTVTESTRLGVLPSETEFGMAAILPGRTQAFKVKLNDGHLCAYRNGRVLNTERRHEILKSDGWSVAKDTSSSDWSGARVAYMDTELDDIGETNLTQIEKKLADRVEELADLIFNKMRQGNWKRAYVVTDHGFVLLPEKTRFESLTPPDGDIKRRRVAPTDGSADGPGVLLTRSPALSYLESNVNILVDPQHRFKKQGISDTRYYHGGALPQECILSFLTIEAA